MYVRTYILFCRHIYWFNIPISLVKSVTLFSLLTVLVLLTLFIADTLFVHKCTLFILVTVFVFMLLWRGDLFLKFVPYSFQTPYSNYQICYLFFKICNNNDNKFINKIDIRKIYNEQKYRMMIISSLLVAVILASKAKGNQLQKFETRTRHMLLRSGTLLYETISQQLQLHFNQATGEIFIELTCTGKKIEDHNKKNN